MSLLTVIGRWLISLDSPKVVTPPPAPAPIAPPASLQNATVRVPISSAAATLASRLPRGIRNNNPGNIRWGASLFQGTAQGPHADPSFVTFVSMEYGVRAAGVLFLHYQRVTGLKTIRQFINRWAPPVENDTGAYVSAVAKGCGVSPDDIFDLGSKDHLQALLTAVFIHENGGSFVSDGALSNGTDLALR